MARIRAVRPFFALGRLFPAGEVRSFGLLAAADVVASGRGELVDAADEPRLRAAVQAAAVAAVQSLPRDATPARPRGYF